MATRSLRVPDNMEPLLRAAAGLRGESVQAYILHSILWQIADDSCGPNGKSLAKMLADVRLISAPKKRTPKKK